MTSLFRFVKCITGECSFKQNISVRYSIDTDVQYSMCQYTNIEPNAITVQCMKILIVCLQRTCTSVWTVYLKSGIYSVWSTLTHTHTHTHTHTLIFVIEQNYNLATAYSIKSRKWFAICCKNYIALLDSRLIGRLQ